MYMSAMSVFVLLSLQEPAYRMCISHNIGFTASCLMTRTVITKRGYARRSLQTRGCVCECVCENCMSGCVRGDACWSASSAPADSHLLPPSSTAQSRTHTSQLSAVNSGDRRKTSYPPGLLYYAPLHCYVAVSHAEVRTRRQHLADHFKDVCFFSEEFLPSL